MSKDNFSIEEMLRLAKAANAKKPEDLLGAMQSKMPDDKMKEIKRILGDKKALEDLLSSEQAQKLMRQFRNGK
ncbi:MAG: hypothetical protein IKW12_04650 [Clostridia bacterium]|nr:hypothetical protein [Clostridia bacterium]